MPSFQDWRFLTLTLAVRHLSPQEAYEKGKDRLRRFLARFREAIGREFPLRFSINDLKGRLITLQERRRLDCGFEFSDERISDWRAGAGGVELAAG
jgi:hypothetical protein